MRAAVLRWTVAMLTAALGLFLAPSPQALVDPSHCNGLAHALSIALARISPDTPAAAIVTSLNGVAVFGALLLFWQHAHRVTVSAIAATAVTLALGSTSMFVHALAPTAAPGMLVVTLAGLVWLTHFRDAAPRSRRREWMIGGSAMLVAITVPTLTVPIVVVILMARLLISSTSAGPTGLRAWISAGVVLAGVAGILLVPALARPESIGPEPRLACLIPFATTATAAPTATQLVLADLAPVPLAAALLGLFHVRRFLRTRLALVLAAAALLPLVLSRGHDAEARLSLAPMWIGFWIVAGCGLSEMLSALQATWTRRVVAMAIAAMLPLLQISRARAHEPEPRNQARGHEAMTAISLSSILGVMPDGGVLILDDALTDLLARSQAGTRRVTSRRVLFLEPDPQAIEGVLSSHRVYALPRAQYLFGHSGFELRTDFQPRVNGVAELAGRARCQRLTAAWSDVPPLLDATQFTVMAPQPSARGPLVIYLGLAEHSEPRPLEWPNAARRGLSGRTYDRSRARDSDDLNRQRELDLAFSTPPLFDAPIVVRLELWRVPGGPMMLPVEVGTPIRGAIARLQREDAEPLTLCRSSIGEIEPVR